MTGYSLHIGLNYVDPNAYGGWNGELAGCINDANSMRQLAMTQGFRPTQLVDGQATSHAVIGEISLLAQQASAGDICLITYSGHGGQVDDNNGDEDDMQDETWVLYDRQVVDDELYQMWSQFAAGVRLLVISDSCHSGTVARQVLCQQSRAAMRSVVGEPRDSASGLVAVDAKTKNLPFDVQMEDNRSRRGTYQFVQALSGAKSVANIQAQLILISGCQDNQLSYDGAVNGQFTGTLLRVWAQGAFQGDHRMFHRAILDQMPPDQTPNLYTVGAVSPDFMAQRPFTLGQPVGGGGSVPAPTHPVTASRPTLREGASGPDVVYLQQRLNAHGATLVADGQFGPMTTMAVRAFQGRQGLSADGVVGPQTWNALETAAITGGVGAGGGTIGGQWGGGQSGGGQPGGGQSGGGQLGGGQSGGGQVPGGTGTGTASTGGSTGVGVIARPTIRRGSTGEHVTYLQGRLSSLGYHLSVDGVFGPGTESTVRSFQRSNSLSADGVVGAQTWAAIG